MSNNFEKKHLLSNEYSPKGLLVSFLGDFIIQQPGSCWVLANYPNPCRLRLIFPFLKQRHMTHVKLAEFWEIEGLQTLCHCKFDTKTLSHRCSMYWHISPCISVSIVHCKLGVSKNSGTPKWMVYNGNPIKMDDLGVPLFSETSNCCVNFQRFRV